MVEVEKRRTDVFSDHDQQVIVVEEELNKRMIRGKVVADIN